MDSSKEDNKNKKGSIKNLILIVIAVSLAAMPLFFLKKAEFAGTDDKAEKAILEIRSDYKPWFSSVWKPPSSEVESLIFSVQAALGAGLIGYYLGYVRGRKKADREKP